MRSRTTKRIDDEPRERKKPAAETVRVPHDPVNEMVVIATALVDAEARRTLTSSISPDSYFGEHHAAIWGALRELEQRKLAFDPATLRQLAPEVDHDYVEQLLRQRPKPPDAATLRHHVECLHQDRARIELARGPLQEFLEAIRDPRATPDRLRGLVDRMQRGLQGHGSASVLRRGSTVVRESLEALRRRRAGHATRPFGIPGLDYDGDTPRLLPGTMNRQVSLVTGLSGSGKSTTMMNAILGMVGDGRKLLVGSWEMESSMTLELVTTIALGWSRTEMMLARYSDEHLATYEQKAEELAASISFFELPDPRKSRGRMNEHQLDLIQSVVADSGCDVFVADLFKRALKETKPEEEEEALIRMQSIAKETNSHVILVHQQRLKDIEGRVDKIPTREGVKGSGAYVEIPDQIIAWHRPAQWKSIPDDKIEAFVLKQRFGKWPIRVELDWDPEYGYVGAGRTVTGETGYEDDGNPDEDLDAFLGQGKSGKGKKR